ncbi:hypothetical protein C2845_PM09G00830 [Panicum miliaceum]|uniref:F-box domain-containing protein n=1 Tax=Panicum miliaceum TaxID=4540 RepID=A0A3L6S276_PANMI|nr:hypothetical protein C2845_PM09G00830 [Panicum miliaceum]
MAWRHDAMRAGRDLSRCLELDGVHRDLSFDERHGLRVSLATAKGPTCQHGDISEDSGNTIPVLELDKFPEDILHHILSLVPLRDAARAACVSRRFLRSWRRFPNLTFNWETVGLNFDKGPLYERAKKLANRIHHILENHSGIEVKTLKLQVRTCGDVIIANHLDIWLRAAVKSGIVELALDLPRIHNLRFNLSCSLISSVASSLQSFSLSYCAFHPTLTIGLLRNVKNVCLTLVHITEEELGCFLSCTTSLEKLEVSQCDDITCLKIPSHLQQLSILRVFLCRRLHMIEINALSINNSSQLRRMTMNGQCFSGMFQYALTKLQSIASNLQSLTLLSSRECFNMPSLPDKFLHLRNLKIHCFVMENFDFFPLVSFLKACPALESFFLLAGRHLDVRRDSIMHQYSDSSHTRRVAEVHQDNLKKVTITGFCSAKSLIELTWQILESSSSLQCLVLDTTSGYDNTGICNNMERKAVMEALRGVEAIKKYIKGKVPSRVNLEVLEPCGRCHIPNLHKPGR